MSEESFTEEYDVIVVGAGFGGPVAARKCALAGLKTLMLERSENVGEKVISGLTIPLYGFLFGPAFIREGNPPIERPVDGIVNYIIKDIDKEDIEIDDTLKIPKPLSPVIAFGFNAYCKPFCEWEARKAIEAGVILRTSTTVTELIKEGDQIIGVITAKGERIKSKIIIDAEGSQGLLAIKASIREKYPPETISLADTYDYEMPKPLIDKIFGHSVWFCWAWDELKLTPPLGFGNGLMLWPYRRSLHFMQDQCLKLKGNIVPNMRKTFDLYHENITTKLPWWKNLVAPHVKLRARMWEGFEIFVGLNPRLRKMKNHGNGILLIGDAAGLESTELCDGVPAAWFSAEIAASVAIEAIKKKDVSEKFLKKYDTLIKSHPLIQWSISGTNRYNLRYAQEKHDLKLLRKYVHAGWGIAAMTHVATPLMKMVLSSLNNDPFLLTKWIKMYCRYYYNWAHERFDFTSKSTGTQPTLKKEAIRFSRAEKIFETLMKILDNTMTWMRRHSPKWIKYFTWSLANSANQMTKLMLHILEPIYIAMLRLMNPISEKLSKKITTFVVNAHPLLFEEQPIMEVSHHG
ncbi:MAG: NAD(P)/FAD-dependent oxidoreductase [Promethearchaeota archaeon]